MNKILASPDLISALQQAIALIPNYSPPTPSADWRTAQRLYVSSNFRTESSGSLVHFDISPKGDMLLLTFEYRIVLVNSLTGKEIRNIKFTKDDDYSDFLKKENSYGIKTVLAGAYFSVDTRWMIMITSESEQFKSIAIIFDLLKGNPTNYIETFSNDTTISMTEIEQHSKTSFCQTAKVSVFDEETRAEKMLIYPKYRAATKKIGNDARVRQLVELIDKTPFAEASAMMAPDQHWLAIETNPKTIQIRSISEVRGAVITSDHIVGYAFTADSQSLFVADQAGYFSLWQAGE